MKLRIKGNSLRIRLNKSEVNEFVSMGYLEEHISFGNNKLIYALQSSNELKEMVATFEFNKISVIVPAILLVNWPENATVGFKATMPLTETDSLYLLLEKDFVCLDETIEDQSDNYENPNKSC